MEDFVCLGSLNRDHYFYNNQTLISMGGSAANTAYFLNRLCKLAIEEKLIQSHPVVYLCGLIGSNEIGDWVLENIQSHGLPAKGIQKTTGKTGSTHISLDAKGERTIHQVMSAVDFANTPNFRGVTN